MTLCRTSQIEVFPRRNSKVGECWTSVGRVLDEYWTSIGEFVLVFKADSRFRLFLQKVGPQNDFPGIEFLLGNT